MEDSELNKTTLLFITQKIHQNDDDLVERIHELSLPNREAESEGSDFHASSFGFAQPTVFVPKKKSRRDFRTIQLSNPDELDG